MNFKLLVNKKIPIECCLTSNVKCGTVKSYEDHHFKRLHEMKHPVVICVRFKKITIFFIENLYM